MGVSTTLRIFIRQCILLPLSYRLERPSFPSLGTLMSDPNTRAHSIVPDASRLIPTRHPCQRANSGVANPVCVSAEYTVKRFVTARSFLLQPNTEG